jgi:LmbE family N-acetylglucosaminyl deacetylase
MMGAHCDDIEIGCGGTLMRLVRRYPDAQYVWMTFSGDDQREAETREAAKRLLTGASNLSVLVERFRGSYFPHCGPELKECIDGLKRFAPDLVLTHFRGDLHQDHRVINELTWNTFRDQAILEYEIPKYDGDVSVPNTYVSLSRDDLARKCQILMDCFPSQRSRAWFSQDTFQAMARLRGIECNAPEGFAEAFYSRKTCIAL